MILTQGSMVLHNQTLNTKQVNSYKNFCIFFFFYTLYSMHTLLSHLWVFKRETEVAFPKKDQLWQLHYPATQTNGC